jgi:hypothetical protein
MIDPDDERTALSQRASAAVGTSADDAPDDRTLPSRRARARTTDAGAPAPSDAAPRRSTAIPPDVDITAVSSRSAGPQASELTTQAATASGAFGPRRSAPADAGEADDRPAGPARTGASSWRGRVSSPPQVDGAVYRARPLPAANTTRAEPGPRAPQAYIDTAAAEAALRRRRRRRAIVVVGAASVLAVVVAVSLVVLLTVG